MVIPTRNRAASLDRALRALARQVRPPDEVIVVDASDQPPGETDLQAAHPTLDLRHRTADAGVCAQRNLGIRAARGSHVLLMDDDIEAPPDYIDGLAAYLETHPTAGAVTGALSEPDRGGTFREGFEVPSVRHLLFAFVFQLTVWGDVEAARGGAFGALPLALLRRWYRRRGNTWSLAGWPLVTQVQQTAAPTAVYGLGAALVRREWLLASPYDERLGPHGIGDNYGVALGFPGTRAVTVLTDLPVRHHRESANRLDAAEASFRRVLALDYFLRTRPRFGPASRAFLAWSLMGRSLRAALRGERRLLRATLRALGVVVRGSNPLLGPEAPAREEARDTGGHEAGSGRGGPPEGGSGHSEGPPP